MHLCIGILHSISSKEMHWTSNILELKIRFSLKYKDIINSKCKYKGKILVYYQNTKMMILNIITKLFIPVFIGKFYKYILINIKILIETKVFFYQDIYGIVSIYV